jgi:hypothetical protein
MTERKKIRGLPEMPPRGEVSDETIEEFIAISRKLALDKIEDYKQSQHRSLWKQLEEDCMEEHEDRVGQIKLWAHQKRTGLPF